MTSSRMAGTTSGWRRTAALRRTGGTRSVVAVRLARATQHLSGGRLHRNLRHVDAAFSRYRADSRKVALIAINMRPRHCAYKDQTPLAFRANLPRAKLPVAATRASTNTVPHTGTHCHEARQWT